MNKLISTITDQFKLPINSTHGLPHWKRVEALGIYLSMHTGADKVVVQHFAYLHDSQRINEDEDPQHGLLAGRFAHDLFSQGLLNITKEQEHLLETTCEVHSATYTMPADPTIATCLDADRLDLWRLGIQPSPMLLFTDIGKEISTDKQKYAEIIKSCNP